VLAWTAGAVLIGAAVVAVRWRLRYVDAIGRRRPFPYLSVSALALIGAGLMVPVVRHERLKDRLASVASRLAGSDVAVHCQGPGGEFFDAGAELGYVRWGADGHPEPATLIKRQQCRHLAAYLDSRGDSPSDAEVIAVHVLAHEAMHMSGVMEESETECLAVQRDAETARLMGATPAAGAALARRYWRVFYPNLSEVYRNAECAPGRALDRHWSDPPW
jgi:hypothetical protein